MAKKKKKKGSCLILEEWETINGYERVTLSPKGKIFKETRSELGPTDITCDDGSIVTFANVTLSSRERLA